MDYQKLYYQILNQLLVTNNQLLKLAQDLALARLDIRQNLLDDDKNIGLAAEMAAVERQIIEIQTGLDQALWDVATDYENATAVREEPQIEAKVAMVIGREH